MSLETGHPIEGDGQRIGSVPARAAASVVATDLEEETG
jgi:hypothetical protein